MARDSRVVAAAVLLMSGFLATISCGVEREFSNAAGASGAAGAGAGAGATGAVGESGAGAASGGNAGVGANSGGGNAGAGANSGEAGNGGDSGSDVACIPGTKKCTGLQPETCDPDGNWQEEGEPCSGMCLDGVCGSCVEDSQQCNGLQRQVCDATGLWQDEGSACPFVCDAASGTCQGSCTPTSKRCADLQPQGSGSRSELRSATRS